MLLCSSISNESIEVKLIPQMHIHAFTGSLLQDHKIRESRGDGWKFLSSSFEQV